MRGTGDGLTMAVGAGAALAGMGRFYGHLPSINAPKRERLSPYTYLDVLVIGGTLVAKTEAQFLLIERAGTPTPATRRRRRDASSPLDEPARPAQSPCRFSNGKKQGI